MAKSARAQPRGKTRGKTARTQTSRTQTSRAQTSRAKTARFNPARNLPPPKPKSEPGTTKSTRNAGNPWTSADVKELKALAKQNTPTRVIGLKLGRTEASIRGKVRQEGISLNPPNRSPYTRRKK